jgi:hypothetical protein
MNQLNDIIMVTVTLGPREAGDAIGIFMFA